MKESREKNATNQEEGLMPNLKIKTYESCFL
jgi:hypothetical protein